jgi:hypothetical protein
MNRDELISICENCDIESRYYELIKNFDDIDLLENKNAKQKIKDVLLGKIVYKEQAVLGYDIYGYSKYEIEAQTLIPFVFDLIYQNTIDNILDSDGCFFEGYSFEENYISTGDGCFQIFDNPLQAFIFNANFYITIHRYNSYRFYPKLRAFTDEILFRSCITFGDIFQYGKNHYGPAIINNARILSRDRLNRFLIDDKTYKWFLYKIDGIENLTDILLEELLQIMDIFPDWGKTALFRTLESYNQNEKNNYGREYCKIKSCHVQKIGDVTAKANLFSVYNVELQIYVFIFNPKASEVGRSMIVPIGNSNSSGIA